ncbi:hypothetical protein GPA24_01430 [Aromatoleum bremense]|uniref:Uncharacterized protein n=1 Tax=Aromatoleum bremense TaxID=76115 RepID=A0ABX1NQH8_9RHOO|nr:hypothetical protein [Aromatoleum bremense]
MVAQVDGFKFVGSPAHDSCRQIGTERNGTERNGTERNGTERNGQELTQ